MPEGEGAEPVEYLIPKGKHIAVQEGDYVQRGDLLIDGNPVPHDILRVLGVEALAEYLVNEIQEVYRLQGVKINDKHIEVIVRQMLQKVEITDAGDTTFLVGEQVDKQRVRDRERQAHRGEAEACQGATRCCRASPRLRLQTKSFISAASFQETTRVLTEAAVSGKVDNAAGPQGERHRRPPDPGRYRRVVNRLKAIAAQRDRAILAAGNEAEDSRSRRSRKSAPPTEPIVAHRNRKGRRRKATASFWRSGPRAEPAQAACRPIQSSRISCQTICEHSPPTYRPIGCRPSCARPASP